MCEGGLRSKWRQLNWSDPAPAQRRVEVEPSVFFRANFEVCLSKKLKSPSPCTPLVLAMERIPYSPRHGAALSNGSQAQAALLQWK